MATQTVVVPPDPPIEFAAPLPLEDEVHTLARPRGTKAMLAPVLVVLTIGAIFVSVYLAAFHAPRPHGLPVVVVASARSLGAVESGLARALPGEFRVVPAASLRAARDEIEHRRTYAAYIPVERRAVLLYASANGPSVTALLNGVFGAVAKTQHLETTGVDVVPAARGDTRGLAIFYAAFGLVLAGFLFGSVTYQIGPELTLRQRFASLILFGVSGGLVITSITKLYGALPGPFLLIAAVVALIAAAAAAASMALVRLLGGAGASVGAILLLVLGNATSGGSLPPAYLPHWLHPFSELMPVGVGVRALDGVAYFHDDGLITAIAILSIWITGCVGLLYLTDLRRAFASTRRQTA